MILRKKVRVILLLKNKKTKFSLKREVILQLKVRDLEMQLEERNRDTAKHIKYG